MKDPMRFIKTIKLSSELQVKCREVFGMENALKRLFAMLTAQVNNNTIDSTQLWVDIKKYVLEVDGEFDEDLHTYAFNNEKQLLDVYMRR